MDSTPTRDFKILTRREGEKKNYKLAKSFRKDVKFFVQTPWNWLGFKTREEAENYCGKKSGKSVA